MSELKQDKKTFEQNLNDLEKIAANLEKGDLNLDQAIAEFELGMKLSKECTKKLDEAERKINILVQKENGEVQEEEFSTDI